ncbi:hypothetical protein [Microcoleus sp. LEGE 07076]|uniref:hypothetical protein n=1 Tax=Microcoleus sp. LEGE 07076 TaxID=915322 RepID=UPI0030DDCC13
MKSDVFAADGQNACPNPSSDRAGNYCDKLNALLFYSKVCSLHSPIQILSAVKAKSKTAVNGNTYSAISLQICRKHLPARG